MYDNLIILCLAEFSQMTVPILPADSLPTQAIRPIYISMKIEQYKNLREETGLD